MRQQQKFEQRIAVLEAQLATVNRERSTPHVSNFWSGLVASSPESIGGVAITAASVPIAIVGAGAGNLLGIDPDGCLQIAGIVLAAGTGFGSLCLGAGAIDLVEITGNLSDRFFTYRERVAELKLKAPQTVREIPVYSNGKQQPTISSLSPTEFKVNTLTIPSVNIASGEREIAVDKVCLFLKSAVASGNWSRDTQAVLNKKEHPDVKEYLKGKGFWKLTPPTLPRACAELRGGGTNQFGRDGTGGGTI